MTEENRLRLKEQIPPELKMDGAVDYPNDFNPYAVVMGTLGKYGIKIEWKYISDPDEIYFSAISLKDVVELVVPVDQLKDNLLKLI